MLHIKIMMIQVLCEKLCKIYQILVRSILIFNILFILIFLNIKPDLS